jgi:hypothetical protein
MDDPNGNNKTGRDPAPLSRTGQVLRRNADKAKERKKESRDLLQELTAETIPASTPPQIDLQIPLFPVDKSAMPHKWTRTSLFMSLAAGKRTKHVETHLASRNDIVLLYTGEQLDMADNDVFLHALRLAQFARAGEPIHFVRSHFLESIGRAAGTSGYKWLLSSLKRMASATLFVENANGDGRMFRLIKELCWKRQTEEFWLALDPEIVRHFVKNELAHIDFRARLELRAPLAKWLQNYASGHRAGDMHCVSAENLRVWSGGGEMRNFLSKDRGLPKALRELEAAGVIESPEIYTGKSPGSRGEKMVRWWRPSDFGKWLRDYATKQSAGWHQVDTEELRGASTHRTAKTFLAPGKGLQKALTELEKLGVIQKAEIYTERNTDGKAVIRARWWKPADEE